MAEQNRKVKAGLPCSNAIEGRAACGFDPKDGGRSLEALRSCTICASAAKLQCSICATWYCEPKCLRKDWPHHKFLCRSLRDDFSNENAPANNVRAILFPMDTNQPTWVWINLKVLDLSITRALGITMPKPLKKAVNQLAAVDINKSLAHREIGHGIRQFTAPKARFGGHQGHHINKSIFALADPGSLKTYFGSAIYIGFRTDQAHGTPRIYYEDTSPRDLRMIIEWYHTRPENPFISKAHRLPLNSYSSYGSPKKDVSLWPAFKLNCLGDTDRLNELTPGSCIVWEVQQVQVLSEDILGSRMESDFIAMAELPWVVQPVHGTFDPVADEGKETDLLYNKGGMVFAPQIKRSFHSWHLDTIDGWVLPAHLTSEYCGSFLVMHKDGDLIIQEHVECFCEFVKSCLDAANPLMTYATNEEGVRRALIGESELAQYITRENFEAFWRGLVGANAEEMMYHPSPYEI
ncbi:hypothetical protein F4808DRAFT_474937 [Astrocystis sublimbata]|nr:hypothetical protein F4808DRAFT_474937 [Astrocystis sublimbata]